MIVEPYLSDSDNFPVSRPYLYLIKNRRTKIFSIVGMHTHDSKDVVILFSKSHSALVPFKIGADGKNSFQPGFPGPLDNIIPVAIKGVHFEMAVGIDHSFFPASYLSIHSAAFEETLIYYDNLRV